MLFLYILVFFISSFLLTISSKLLVDSLSKIAKFLSWKEFVVAFLLSASSASIPNLFVGIISALEKVPELSLGDVVGGNIIDLSLLAGISALISKMGLSAPSRTVQGSAIFLILVALLLLILTLDNFLSKIDGFLLILTFLSYLFWLFSKEERFKKVYDHFEEEINLKKFFQNLAIFFSSAFIVLIGARGIVESAKFFGKFLNLNLGWIGMLIVAFGNALPETFFSFHSAREGQDWLILGNLIGSVVITSSLVLGIVSLICPIQVFDFSAILIGRIFLITSALFFFFSLRTEHKITKREAFILISIYFFFLLVEILIKQ